MKNNVDTIMRRTQRNWYVDGLAEIMVGLFFMVVSGYTMAQAQIKTSTINPIVANLVLLAGLLLVLWIFRYALGAVKDRLTYTRTGYVASPGRQKSLRWQRYGFAGWLVVVCISLLILTLHTPSAPRWTPLLMGAIGGLTVLALSYRLRLLRFALLACALVLIGAAVSFFNPSLMQAEIISSIAGGVCFILSGGVTLVRYLRSTQPSGETDL